MGLRDSIRAGKEELATFAAQLIETYGIAGKIKNAVFRGESMVSIEINGRNNFKVILDEMIKQITAEGFNVDSNIPCCWKVSEVDYKWSSNTNHAHRICNHCSKRQIKISLHITWED
jgi:hypothetical protein